MSRSNSPISDAEIALVFKEHKAKMDALMGQITKNLPDLLLKVKPSIDKTMDNIEAIINEASDLHRRAARLTAMRNGQAMKGLYKVVVHYRVHLLSGTRRSLVTLASAAKTMSRQQGDFSNTMEGLLEYREFQQEWDEYTSRIRSDEINIKEWRASIEKAEAEAAARK